MNKIGLITIHDTQNYGSCLQTYSLWRAINENGYDVELIDYINEEIWTRERGHLENIFSNPKKFARYILWGKAQKEKLKGIRSFLVENTRVSQKYDKNNIKDANLHYDTFVTGSDIVWGLQITGNDTTYFLDFTGEDKKRLAISSSIGTKWNLDQENKVKPYLLRYDKISVREELASKWLKEILNKEIYVTCDPTNLWEPSFWNEYVLEDYAPKEDYVLIYAVNPDGKNITDGVKFAREHNMKAYFINFYGHKEGTETLKPVTVSQWITLFAKANTVFSASYHGLLFSLYFKKPVFFYNRGEKSRMISLASELGIENREGLEENLKANMPMDYEFITRKLTEKRKYSWSVINEVLPPRREKEDK